MVELLYKLERMDYMAETYCGKSCDTCLEKTKLNCPGCRFGPGRAYAGDCTIAKCCMSRNLQSCADCTVGTTCFNRCSSNSASSSRLKRQIDAADRQQRLYERSGLLGKWLGALFWLVIVRMVFGLALNDTILLAIPSLMIPAAVIGAAFSVCYALILFKLNPASDHYRTAGISMLFCAALNLVIKIMGESGWSVALAFVAVIPAFMMEFQEYMGHSDATEALDPDMAEKWRKLWYWNFGCVCATVISTLLTVIGLDIAALVVIVAAIGTLAVSIIKIVYLYSTAKAFLEYAEESPEIV